MCGVLVIRSRVMKASVQSLYMEACRCPQAGRCGCCSGSVYHCGECFAAQAITDHGDGLGFTVGQTAQLMSYAICVAAACCSYCTAALVGVCSSALLFSPHAAQLDTGCTACGVMLYLHVCTAAGRHR